MNYCHFNIGLEFKKVPLLVSMYIRQSLTNSGTFLVRFIFSTEFEKSRYHTSKDIIMVDAQRETNELYISDHNRAICSEFACLIPCIAIFFMTMFNSLEKFGSETKMFRFIRSFIKPQNYLHMTFEKTSRDQAQKKLYTALIEQYMSIPESKKKKCSFSFPLDTNHFKKNVVNQIRNQYDIFNDSLGQHLSQVTSAAAISNSNNMIATSNSSSVGVNNATTSRNIIINTNATGDASSRFTNSNGTITLSSSNDVATSSPGSGSMACASSSLSNIIINPNATEEASTLRRSNRVSSVSALPSPPTANSVKTVLDFVERLLQDGQLSSSIYSEEKRKVSEHIKIVKDALLTFNTLSVEAKTELYEYAKTLQLQLEFRAKEATSSSQAYITDGTGQVGIDRRHNNCYINVILQVLSHMSNPDSLIQQMSSNDAFKVVIRFK